jgi:hypothetical protein
VSPVRYELWFYIPDDGILHSHRREHPQILHLKACFRTGHLVRGDPVSCVRLHLMPSDCEDNQCYRVICHLSSVICHLCVRCDLTCDLLITVASVQVLVNCTEVHGTASLTIRPLAGTVWTNLKVLMGPLLYEYQSPLRVVARCSTVVTPPAPNCASVDMNHVELQLDLQHVKRPVQR